MGNTGRHQNSKTTFLYREVTKDKTKRAIRIKPKVGDVETATMVFSDGNCTIWTDYSTTSDLFKKTILVERESMKYHIVIYFTPREVKRALEKLLFHTPCLCD